MRMLETIEKLDGIEKAEAGYSVDALCTEGDNQIVMHVMSLLPSMNQVQVENGRLPEKSDECVVDADFSLKSTLKIGDRVTLSSGTDKTGYGFSEGGYFYDRRKCEQSMLY